MFGNRSILYDHTIAITHFYNDIQAVSSNLFMGNLHVSPDHD